MITKMLEFDATRTGPNRLAISLRIFVATFLSCAVTFSQLGSPVILVTNQTTDTEAPVSENETQDSELNVSEALCVAIGRHRSLSCLTERAFHAVETRLSVRLSALTALFLSERRTPDRAFNLQNGIGAMLRC